MMHVQIKSMITEGKFVLRRTKQHIIRIQRVIMKPKCADKKKCIIVCSASI